MNDREILDRLWEEYSETPFASLTMQRKLDLRPQEDTATRKLLGDMSDSGEVRSGYRIKRVASAMYKLIPQAQGDSDSAKGLPQAQGDSDSLKGKPLIDEKESLTGEPESDCLSTDGENAVSGAVKVDTSRNAGENHTSGQDDPFPDAENMNIGCLLMPLRQGIPIFRTAQDKANFDEKKLTWWEYHDDATPFDIIQYADKGRVFVPGQFVKCPEKNRFRHTKATWQGAQMIACDADQIKGVEFDEGKDKTPGGVEAFTDPKRLLELYPASDMRWWLR